MMHLKLLVHGCLIIRHNHRWIRSKYCRPLSRTFHLSKHLTNSSLLKSFISSNMGQHKPLVIIFAGPTASGKSAVAALLSSPSWATAIITGHALSNIKNSNSNNSTASTTRGHVISADSVQVYCGVQIGANKPTLEEMKQTPHHLVSIIEPQVAYNAADWRNDALYVIRKLTGSQAGGEEEERFEPIHKEKMDKFIESTFDTSKYSSILPIVTGGTMMYLQWLVHGFPDAAKPTKEAILRAAEIIQSYQEMDDDDTRYEHGANVVTSNKGWIQAIQYVASLGPIFAQRVLSLSENDWYRLRRTLEVALTALPGAAVPNHHHYIPDDSLQDPSLYMNTPEITNQDTAINTIDSKDRTIQSLYTGQREGGLDTFDFDVRCFFLCPDDRMAHSKIVDRRCEDMILAGLITETTQLYLNGSLPEDGQQTRAIGYRQTLDYLLRSDWKEKDKDAFSNYFNEFTGATRRYSKKQMQWFRKDDAFVFIPISMSEENISARVENAASRIRDLCMQTRQQYESERSSIDSISSETKVQNAKQSDGMKFYLTKRYRIVSGSSDMDRILDEADTCVKMIRSSCIR